MLVPCHACESAACDVLQVVLGSKIVSQQIGTVACVIAISLHLYQVHLVIIEAPLLKASHAPRQCRVYLRHTNNVVILTARCIFASAT